MMEVPSASPGGVSDDDDVRPSVLESTAADPGGLAGPRGRGYDLPEISLISSPQDDQPLRKEVKHVGIHMDKEDDVERVQVYLRVRPVLEAEKERGEEQGCVFIHDQQTVVLKAPTDSFNMKGMERGTAQSMHKFTFTQISGPETTQQEFFECTTKELVQEVLRGENRLLFTYGITNSGKTYTVQGTSQKAGLLPRTLVALFRKLQGHLSCALELKPVLCQEVRVLDHTEVQAEEIRRDKLLHMTEGMMSQNSRLRDDVSISCDSGFWGASTVAQLEDSDSVCLEAKSLSQSGEEGLPEGVQFSVWVSFFEIYNEFLYDLLDSTSSSHRRKRSTLRLCEDRHGNPYVKDLTWMQVRSAEEAWKVLKVGRSNQSFAGTHMNHVSSRSHSIFNIRILHTHPGSSRGQNARISELSVCDLAGSERCRNQQNGERIKEATNINTSLHTLGRCLNALRYNQANRSRPPLVVPFRDSKLTRVLQGFFCGRGRSIMVVNINPCASSYDETLHALKFSAVAMQLVHIPSTKTRVAYILSLLQGCEQRASESTLLEEEDGDEEGDVTMFDCEELLRAIEVLKGEVLRQREEKETLEGNVREQVFSEMMEVIRRMEKDFSETLETERELMQERYEDKIQNLQKSLRRYYIQEIEERDERIKKLTEELGHRKELGGQGVSLLPASEGGPPQLGNEGHRHSRRNTSSQTAELSRVREQLVRCQAELQEKTEELRSYQGQTIHTSSVTVTVDNQLEEGHKNLRQLRVGLQQLSLNLRSGERVCCSNTSGERLRTMLAAAEGVAAKQEQTLVELQKSWMTVRMELRKKSEDVAGPQLPTPGSFRKKGHPNRESELENKHPKKKRSVRCVRNAPPVSPATPFFRALRSRQQSPLS
ncbi:kinesin-like protein KIF20A [Scleropages formosus]|uniref:kinesin-like protein KIF20A n=1 Tax=Scleropages formosus TaxID=113540 RepID=UPI0010FA7DE3|nr:kinesin-like protein KIF20A [Scleropages formosus]XP_029107217.1 kinesin-like protein KIF20A [Scleropages formosus]